jgi:hypothetical protein
MIEFSLAGVSKNKSKLFIPDIDYILKFMDGDVGITDIIFKESIVSVISRTIEMMNTPNTNDNTRDLINSISKDIPQNDLSDVEYLNSPEVIKYAADKNINLSSVKYTNKISDTFSKKEIMKMVLAPFKSNIDEIDDGVLDSDNWKNELVVEAPEFSGLKPFEKSSVQSIFETMKPYAEMLKILLQSLVKIEDIIAMVLGITGLSLVPAYNPKALGYRGGDKVAEQYYRYLEDILKHTNGANTTDRDNNGSLSVRRKPKLVSEETEYSTGEYDENYTYDYSYIDIYDESFNKEFPSSFDFSQVDEPIDKLPETIIVGFYDKYGNRIDTTNDKMPDWIRYNVSNYTTFEQYGNNYNEFKDLVEEMVIDKMPKHFKETTPNYRILIKEALMKVDLPEMYEKIMDNGFLKTILKDGVPHTIKTKTFKPKKVKFLKEEYRKLRDAAKLEELGDAAFNHVWIDVESDYDLKLMKVTPFKVNDRVANTHLNKLNVPYLEKAYYGFPDSENRQSLGTLQWYYSDSMKNNGYYVGEVYILQGILDSDSKESIKDNKKKRYYKFKDQFKIPFRFVSIITDIIAKLIPSLNGIITLFKNPVEFILQILLAKLGDNNGTENIKYLMFSSKAINDYNKFKTIFDGIKNDATINEINDEAERKNVIYEKASKELKNMAFIKDLLFINKETLELRFLNDGAAVIELFGYVFGIDVNFPKFDFIFKKLKNNKSNETDNYESGNKNLPQDIKDIFGNKGEDINSLFPNNKRIRKIVEDTWYSTGEYKSEYNYTWIYLDETQKEIYDEANVILERHKDFFVDFDKNKNNINNSSYFNSIPNEVKKDLKVLNALLSLCLSFGYNDEIFKQFKQIKDLLVDETSSPIIKMILELIATPLKMVKKIVDFILYFFNSIKSPFTLPTKFAEFVKFEWFTEIVNPSFFLKLIGINFDPVKITQLSKYIIGGAVDMDNEDFNNQLNNTGINDLRGNEISEILRSSNSNDLLLSLALVSDKTNIDVKKLINIFESKSQIDLREIISVNFFESMGLMSLEQVKIILEQQIQQLMGILNLIKNIGKAIIQFFYSLFGLNSKQDTPDFDIMKNYLSDNDIKDIIDGSFNGLSIPSDKFDKSKLIAEINNREMIYDISLPDGNVLRGLTIKELVEWVQRNKNNFKIQYNYGNKKDKT